MKFGVKATEEVDQPQGSVRFIKYFNKDGYYTLRFLEPWDEWTSYWEHFSMKYRCSYPCSANTPDERKDCPGCQLLDSQDEADQREGKVGRKYLVNALQIGDERNEGYVNLWKIPGSLKEDLLLNQSKDGSLSKREYSVIRREKNGRTSYSLDKGDPMPIDLEPYKAKLLDHNEALVDAWEYRWNDEKREQAKAEMEERKANSKTKESTEATMEPPPFDLKNGQKAKAGLSIVPDEPAEEETITLTPSGIRKMSVSQLRQLYSQGGFELPDIDDQTALAERLIKELSPA